MKGKSMSEEPFYTSPLNYLPADVALDPVFNALNSMALLNEAEHEPRLDVWVEKAAASLTSKQRRTNRVVFEGLRDVVAPDQEWDDFQSYLEHLTTRYPTALRDQALQRLCRPLRSEAATPAPEQLLADAQAYAARIAQVYSDATHDPAILAKAHALLNDPSALHEVVVAHLTELWETMVIEEWRYQTGRGPESLQAAVNIFRSRLGLPTTAAPLSQWVRGAPDERPVFGPMTAAEALRTFTGRPAPSDMAMPVFDVERVVLIPSAHSGRQITTWYCDGTLRVFFTPLPQQQISYILRASPISHGELLSRLNALSDDTRLRVLTLIAQHDEISAQEIQTLLDLTQSTVSRHLKQLQMYLIERRGEGASKLYRLNPIQLDVTIRGLEQLLTGAAPAVEQAPQADNEAYPRELRRFLDNEGRVTGWPVRERDRMLVLEYLAAKFESGRFYKEKEVNELLKANLSMHPHFDDFATLRRALCDYRFVDRERDGSRYWRRGNRD
jgi:hypothetical protein